MKIHLKQNVWDAAIERTERLFDEFKNVVVSFSGGKDSTVTLEIALIVARKKNRLPLSVYFLDQEAEWSATIDYVRKVMHRKEIKPLWIQVPIFLPNSISQTNPFLITWEEGKEWMRPKEEISIKENHVLKGDSEKEAKTGYWYTYFVKSLNHLYPDEPACFLAGMRAEESPQRLAGLTNALTYKDITWGKHVNKKKDHYTFYPLYDWNASDIWKSIHENKWDYCNIYNEYFRYGLPIKDMRVSNLNHESALKSLFYLHELEGHTWEALNKRLEGINQAKHLSKNDLLRVTTLPYMFKSWREYRDFLTDKLIVDQKHKDIFINQWEKHDSYYAELRNPKELNKKQINSILVNDIEFAKLASFLQTPSMIGFRDWKKGKIVRSERAKTQIKKEYLNE